MNYNFDYISPELKSIIEPAILHTHKFESKLGCRVFKNAYVCPYFDWDKSIGCVIDEIGKVVKDSECIEWKENEDYYNLGESVFEGKTVVFLGFLLTGFGHSYTDDLRKLWFLETEECKLLLQQGARLVYTTSWNNPIPDSVMEIVRMAGFDISQARHITSITQFDEVYVPDNSFIASDNGRLYCDVWAKSIERIRNSVPIANLRIDKVYFSRSKFIRGKKKEYGEKAIERVFRKKRYTIIYPEDHSIIEQIQMVKQCKSFASTEGSVAHLSLFCRSGTEVMIVCKANYLNFHQVMINEYADLNVTYIEAHHSIKVDKLHPWWGPFYLCVNRHLELYVGHRVFHLPYWMMPSYWEYTRNILYKCYNRIRKLLK